MTKVDPAGARLIFSTAVSGSAGALNEGIAVDAAGNVYLTGVAAAGYPYTVPVPDIPQAPALTNLANPVLPFLTKLDASGQKVVYSVPVGGIGVQVDAAGAAYVGGYLGLFGNQDVAAALPALAGVPSGCLPNQLGRGISAYVAKVDPSGNAAGTQFLGGSSLTLSGVALAGATLWTTGATGGSDFPMTANALTFATLRLVSAPGAYVGAVDFGAPLPDPRTPQVACVVDAADFGSAGPIVPNQLLTIFGSGLNGAAVTFGTQAATVLYSSANQINIAVPNGLGPMQVSANGVSSMPLQFAVAQTNPSLFVTPGAFQSTFQAFAAVALNADGSRNSPNNPAAEGSVVSVFVNGMSNPIFQAPLLFAGGGWSVVGSSQDGPYVLKVDLRTPSPPNNFQCVAAGNATSCSGTFSLFSLLGNNTATPSLVGVIYVK